MDKAAAISLIQSMQGENWVDYGQHKLWKIKPQYLVYDDKGLSYFLNYIPEEQGTFVESLNSEERQAFVQLLEKQKAEFLLKKFPVLQADTTEEPLDTARRLTK